MSSITIHNLDAELDQKLTDEARRRKKSKNQFIKDLLAKDMGLRVEGKYSDDYQDFCGLWKREEMDEFNRTQEDNTRVDTQDWQ
ncbi:MAG: hypothetical protein HN368_23990 [Spirochaetales bacterium]|jgi:hypothetical protein|nr:hypothetical protein [Spirochaetales bacterium]